jgi:hypothetical protein
MSATPSEPDAETVVDAALTRLVAELPPNQAALALAESLRRAATRLHVLARQRSSASRGEPDWAAWAGLQNAARSALLQASTCRDLASKLATPRAEER